MLKEKKILLCVTGSIAAYKSVNLLRSLITTGAEVKVIMTKGATDFVSTLTFSTLSKNRVLTDLFDAESWANHVELGRWADVMIVAPATCHTLASMANGLCDNLLLAVYLSSVCPVVTAPAMDEDMWKHPATQNNLETLKKNGVQVIPVENGELASGLYGEGRMAEPQTIIEYLQKLLAENQPLKGIKALVTAGPTYEAFDPVRFIGNYSSGKMGIYLAEGLAQRGAEVNLILGPSHEKVNNNVNTIRVISANEMYNKAMECFEESNIIIMAAAVADYMPTNKAEQKIKKNEEALTLPLMKTKDILSELGKRKSDKQIVVGFALETENEKENALKKLDNKRADFIVLNSLNDKGAGFGHETNKITIFEKNGKEYTFPVKSKKEVAVDIINVITKTRYV